ncbi:DUF1120 domain-containing protein [Cupriavidus sp. BIS7]|uniref:DUF1120 domain-containing protein n=1 Tax=Cupriavidus sp. BIS7 TaxID=1217718 RepID=UPI000315B715|nr:DUF1120 domain-containing protein [Cupriavidus sp. BIS7]
MNTRRLIPIINAIGIASGMLLSHGALAASTAEFRLRADMLPVSCDLSFSNNGEVDFGVIMASRLSDTNFTKFPRQSITATLTCDAAAKVALSVTDGRPGTTPEGMGYFLYTNQNDAAMFGAGSVDGRNIGGYMIYRTANGQADGATAYPVVSNDNGATWIRGVNQSNAITPTRLHSWSATNGGAPSSFTTITQQYFVELALNRKADLPTLNRQIPVDGLATFTIQYL